jgi:pyrroloquinoline quinone biosynthesis protein B
MRIKVLGAAAGGGLPQWNCACENCGGARRGELRPSTQAAIAVSGDGDTWWLLGATPDVARQIEATPELHPRPPRRSPIAGVVLVNGELDQCLGLLVLRESHPLEVLATAAVRRGFERNALARTLARFRGQVTWRVLVPGREATLEGGLTVVAFPAPGKRPLHLSDEPPTPGENVGLEVRDAAGRTMAWLPSVARPTAEVLAAAAEADLVFFDGTFQREDELMALGIERRAAEMGHWPIGGTDGSLAFLSSLPGRRLFIHVNNTNPIWRPRSPERAALAEAGVELAQDGQEIEL